MCAFLPFLEIFFSVSDLACRISSKCMILPNCSPFMDLLHMLAKPLKPSVVDFLRSQQCGFERGFPKVCCQSLPKTIPILLYNPKKIYANVSTEESNKESLPTLTQIVLTTTQKPIVMNKGVKKKKVNMELAFGNFYDDVIIFDALRNKAKMRYIDGIEVR